MRVAVKHAIERRFERPVRLSTHWLRLRPSPQARARVTAYSLRLDADPHFVNWVRDPFENHLARVDFPDPLAAARFEVEYVAELEPVNPLDLLVDVDAAQYPFAYSEQLARELAPYLRAGEPGPQLSRWLSRLSGDGDSTSTSTVARLGEVNQRVQAAHDLTPTTSLQPLDPERVLEQARGSSFDLAWLLTMTLRHLGIGARVVCGHRIALAPEPGGEDSVSLHGWSEAYLPGAGWIGLDPTAGLFTTETYVPLSCAPSPRQVMPLVGEGEGPERERVEQLRVRRLVLPPESALERPCDADLIALGQLVEEDSARRGARLSLGVGLSLVSRDQPDAPEWTFTALGSEKRLAAEALLEGLWKRLAPGGVIQEVQGRWYAGDVLPRWTLACYHRRDGRAAWRDPERLTGVPAEGARADDSRRFARSLAAALGIDPRYVVAAHEDPLAGGSRAALALGPRPRDADLNDPERRRQLAERLSLGQGESVGHVLPIRWDHAEERWSSGAWVFRRDGLYLTPGDSPMGYRLPLASLLPDPRGELEAHIERSPFEERAPLGDPGERVRARLGTPAPAGATLDDGARDGPSDERAPRTALCVQPRAGVLHAFLPPTSHLEHYLELVAALEAASEATQLPVRLEGYPPPEDPGLGRLLIEPDAGVLRVRLPDAERWEQQLALLRTVYEEAERVGLSAERRSADGMRLPAGGEARLTLAGTSPSESPFCRQPALLGNLIAYFQAHPCLSYFFAGRNIGPSGFASRPDEGRDDALYELGIGLEHLPTGDDARPWLSDRVLRHLLTDPAGSLEKAEIRVDELYPPDRAALRLGRIQIGSFETAPDARMAALQSLLVLGLVGRSAQAEPREELQRWGASLHDRFLLPDVLWDDLRHVVADLCAAGYPFQLSWFEPLLELRFPSLGSVQLGEISLELRMAHEPWPLLAEQASAGGMARFVDRANERVQVKLSGLTGDRYVLCCNGRHAPLRSTGTHGEYLAGVRYKVTSPPATLHPTVPPVDALVFDLIDGWSGLAIGGCTYRPARPTLLGPVGVPVASGLPEGTPGGASSPPPRRPPPPPAPPARRSGAFSPEGSGRGPMSAPPPTHAERLPYLLDLTRAD